ncbi:hypothetical protein [Actinoplanes sp. TFC3]|uniref:hypothetical protein n=1 Tax=Actinoplanes sp. TFC3 TaxID=1710355 RepID=UPI000836DA82|nr:hypothetical protein [Actinoplanes sp. TFC3]
MTAVGLPAPLAAHAMCPDSLGRGLLAAAARALHQQDSRGLDRVPILGRHPRAPARRRATELACDAAAAALPPEMAAALDTDAVAQWIVDHYPGASYPAMVLGSAHGGAVHLAAALGAPWLPSGFVVTVRWPGAVQDWRGARDYGRDIAACILGGNPGVSVRQVHDPVQRGPLCGSTLTLHVRWRRIPHAYRLFLRTRLAGGPALMVRDLRNWTVEDLTPGYGFQVGSPVSGWTSADYTTANPAFGDLLATLGVTSWATPGAGAVSRYAETAGEPDFDNELRRWVTPAYRICYPRPGALSAFVADLYRQWWRAAGAVTEHCVVETGTLFDPWRVHAGALVPYWCESAARRGVEAAEMWLAGAEPFEAISVLPQAPGVAAESYAPAELWRSLARFARHRPLLDQLAMSRYPTLPLAASHATTALTIAALWEDRHPVRLSGEHLIAALRSAGPVLGLLVS